MTTDRTPSAPRVEDLLEHASWLRGLAAALVRDAATADDLVQDTWVAAMRSPPPSGVPPRAWLTGIARNLARLRFRSESRRELRQRDAAPATPLPGPVELVERLDTQRRLAALVAELREPVRSVVLLRFYEGLDSSEIAARTGEPPSTVRWRLKQGVDELRARLDADHGGDRTKWTAALLPLAGLDRLAPHGAGAAGQVAFTGGVVMASTTKVAASAAAVLALVAAGIWWASEAGERETAGTSGVAGDTHPAETASRSVAEPQRPMRPRSTDDTAAAGGPADPAAAGEPRPAQPTRIVGRVVDERSEPVRDASVRVVRARSEARSGDDGRFALDLALDAAADAVQVQFAAPRRGLRILSKRATRGATSDLGDVALVAGGSVSGIVVDDAGMPVPRAVLSLTSIAVEDADRPRPAGAAPAVPAMTFGPEGNSMDQLLPAPSGPSFVAADDGTFTLTSVPAGAPSPLVVTAIGRRTVATTVTARADAPVEGVRIVAARLSADEAIEGRVLAPDGSPAADYEFIVEFAGSAISGASTARTDAEGRFHLQTLDQTTYSILVCDPVRGWTSERIAGLKPGRRDVTLTARAARRIEVAARSADGLPIAAFSWQVRTDGSPSNLRVAQFETADAARPARFLVPGGPFTLTVTAPGHASTVLTAVDPATVPERIDVELAPLPPLRGVVRSAAGPVAGAKVTLHAAIDEGWIWFSRGFPLVHKTTAEARATTDANGVYEMTVRESGRYVVRAEFRGLAPSESAFLAVDPSVATDVPPLELGAGGAIEGAVRTGGSANPAGTLVAASRGDDAIVSVTVGADGAFRFDRLTPGKWIVRILEECVLPPPGTTVTMQSNDPIEWTCEVRTGETTRVELGTGAAAACVVRGRFAGPADRRWWVALDHADPSRGSTDMKAIELGADGSFEIRTDRRGDHCLAFMTQGSDLRIRVPVKLAPGEQSVQFAFRAASLEIAGGDANLNVTRRVVWQGDGGATASAHVPRFQDGRAAIPVFPAGRVRVVHWDEKSPGSEPWTWPVDAEADAAPGGVTRIELR